jgi:predicted HTH transcriptional regulator
MTDQEFAQILALGHETRSIEFKSPGPLSSRRLAAQVVRAVLGMANRPDDGRVIIGVEDNGGIINPVGLSVSDLAIWSYDDVAARIAVCADPGVEFDLEVKEYNGNQYIVTQVKEFADIPVLCKRSYDNVLREGACYVRSRRKPETSEVPTLADMRDLLDLATEKRLQEHLALLERVGLIVLPATRLPSIERFEQQRGDVNE